MIKSNNDNIHYLFKTSENALRELQTYHKLQTQQKSNSLFNSHLLPPLWRGGLEEPRQSSKLQD